MTSLFLDALQGANQSGRPPLWIMRQAGRYLPEYQLLRKEYSFWDLCHNPELAAEVTALPFQRFAFDAAIYFSDILVVAEALGCEVRFVESRGPLLEPTFRGRRDLAELRSGATAESLNYVKEGIRLAKQRLQVPLIGFAGGPLTVASYMIEGGSSRDFAHTKRLVWGDPETFAALIGRITSLTEKYLQIQIAAGVDAIQIFESWAGALPPSLYERYILPSITRLVQACEGVPVILFCRNTASYLPKISSLPCALGVDWGTDLLFARQLVGKGRTLQGNLDPQLLFSSPRVVREETMRLLEQMHGDPAWICNLGHGILPRTPLESVETLLQTVHDSASSLSLSP